MSLGFREAFKAGISFGKDDMVIPETKERIIAETRAATKEYEQQYNDGLITQGEKYNKVVDAWMKCSEKLAEEMMIRISTVRKDEHGRDLPINSIYMMSHSGARGSPAQMKQLAAMRGLMTKPSGEIIETPIISNFKEGLTVLEYFNSTHGSRKGLSDTALKTANSGYLTRRLVDVAQDSIITTVDCGTEKGIRMRAIIDAGQVVASLTSRILGRTAAEDLRDQQGKIIVPNGEMIQEWHIEPINAAGLQEVKIRSVLTCESKNGVCGKCYGRDLARGTPVNMGEAVGVIAAQSIGEPGTQLTMRTFHIGGAAQLADQSFVESNFEGTVHIRNRHVARNSDGDLIVMARNVAAVIVGPDGVERAVNRIQYGARLKVDEGDKIKRGERIAEWDPYTRPIVSEVDGAIGFEDLVEGQSVTETADKSTGITKRVVMDWRLNTRSASLKPAILIKSPDGKVIKLQRGGDARYTLPAKSIIAVEPGSVIKAGDIVARISLESAKTRDITGGLPRVAELFEARRPKDHAIIAEITGTVQFGRDYKNKQRLSIVPHEEGVEAVEYLIPKGKHIHLQDGDVVEKGDYVYGVGKGANYKSLMHDITTGNNFSPGSPTKFNASPSYDLCTGWGTPTLNLIGALAGQGTGLLSLNVDPLPESALLSADAQQVYVTIPGVTNATVFAMIPGSPDLFFANDGRPPDVASNDFVYTAYLKVPSTLGSFPVTIVAAAPGRPTATNAFFYTVVAAPANDAFANATKVPDAGAAYLSNNRHSTTEPGEPAHDGDAKRAGSLWWAWTPTISTSVLVNSAGSKVDNVLAVYTGTSLISLQSVAAASSDVAQRHPAQVVFDAQAGQSYRIALASSSSNSLGSLSLMLVPNGQPNTVAPLVTVSGPQSGLTITNQLITVTGFASSMGTNSAGLNKVLVSVNGCASTPASGTTNWASQALLQPELNIIQATAYDEEGNASAPFTIELVYFIVNPGNDFFASAFPLTGASSTEFLRQLECDQRDRRTKPCRQCWRQIRLVVLQPSGRWRSDVKHRRLRF